MKKLYIPLFILCIGAVYLIYSPFLKRFTGMNKRFEKAEKVNKYKPQYDHPDQAALEEIILRSEIGRPFSYKQGYRMKALEKARRYNPLLKSADELVWQEKGPGNVGGRTRSIVVHPTDENTWWSGAVGGGIWKTSDAGESWTCQSDDLPVLSVCTIAICREGPDTLYAGSGEGFYNYDAVVGDGIFKTTNGGGNWQQLASTAANYDFRYVNRIVVHPQNSNIVLAATKSGIFRSTNGGGSWQTVFQNGANVQQIIVNPLNFNTLFAAANGSGIYKSTDMGLTWNKVSEEISGHGRIELAISEADTNYVYAAAVDASSYGLLGFYQSTDAGENWLQILNNPDDNNWLGTQGWYDNTLLVHPFDPLQIFVGGIDLHLVNAASNPVSVDKISNRYTGDNYVHADQHFLAALPRTDGTFALISANDGGVFYSTDGGTNWASKDNNYNVTQFYDADKNPAVLQYIGGTQDNGTRRSQMEPNFASSWDEVVGGDGFDCAWDKGDPERVYATLYSSYIYRSADGGDHFGRVGESSLPESDIFHTPLAMDPHYSKKLFTISDKNKIYVSYDGASNWNGIYCDLDSSRWVKIAVSEKDSNIVWAGGSSKKINVSTDAGKTFNTVQRPDGSPYARLSGLATSPQDSAAALVTFGVYGYGKVFRTHDLGVSWENITSDLPDIPVHCALIMPYDSSEIWLGTDIGLFISKDAGQSWQYANHNLPAAAVRRLKIVGKEIVAATHGRGIWSVLNEKLDQQVIPTNTPLVHPLNLPNPNTNTLKIYITPRGEYDSLSVYLNDLKIETTTHFTAYKDTFITADAVAPGLFTAFARGFKDNLEYTSETESVEVNAPLDSVSDNFDAGSSVFSGDFIISKEDGFDSNTMHTAHNYENGRNYTATLTSAIQVEEGHKLFYMDVALVEPGEGEYEYPDSRMWDYAVVEFSTDGEHWAKLCKPYDSRYNDQWLSYFQSKTPADQTLLLNHDFSLSDSITAGQKAYFRFRLFADEAANGWGWAIDNFYIGLNPPDVILSTNEIPYRFKLNKNYPNPFNPTTVISYQLSAVSQVKLIVYNILGQEVQTLVNARQKAGDHSIRFNAEGLANGMYIYRLTTASGFSRTKKMMYIK